MATLRQTFSDIADAIRAKGVSGTMKPIEMATKIGEIQTGGGSQDYGYLTFTAVEDTTLKLEQQYTSGHKLLKSTDAVNWTKWEQTSTNGISLSAGQSVYIKADEDALWRTSNVGTYNYFSSTGKINCSGDIRSIVKLVGPANYAGWVSRLFDGCTSLITPPELPSKTLDDNCYSFMFYGCTSLTSAPKLPATTLAENCYNSMFRGCTSLTSAPELPATTLAENCYNSMFRGCTSLVKAPELPSIQWHDYCYKYMFKGCTSLTQAQKVIVNKYGNALRSCEQMFQGCTSLVNAPELQAKVLTPSCYEGMFQGCTSLKRIKMNASSGKWGIDMFNGCTSLELVDMTGSTGVPQLDNVNNFANTNDTYKIVVPDSLYDTWIAENNWASIASHIMKQTDWNAAHPDDILP